MKYFLWKLLISVSGGVFVQLIIKWRWICHNVRGHCCSIIIQLSSIGSESIKRIYYWKLVSCEVVLYVRILDWSNKALQYPMRLVNQVNPSPGLPSNIKNSSLSIFLFFIFELIVHLQLMFESGKLFFSISKISRSFKVF